MTTYGWCNPQSRPEPTSFERGTQVTTFTSNKFSAGTDANIFFTMKGPLGSVERRKLDHGPGESLFTNKFERNQADTFFFSGPKVREEERWGSKARGRVRAAGNCTAP